MAGVSRPLRQCGRGWLLTLLCLSLSLASLYQSSMTASRLRALLSTKPTPATRHDTNSVSGTDRRERHGSYSLGDDVQQAPQSPLIHPLSERYHFEQPSLLGNDASDTEDDSRNAEYRDLPKTKTSDRSLAASVQFHARPPRVAHITRICMKLGWKPRPLTRGDLGSIFVNDKYRALHCMLGKVASSNWARVWLVLDGKINATDPANVSTRLLYGPGKPIEKLFSLDHYSNEEIQKRLDTYTTLLFVRNPAERLLSAYRNKLERPNEVFRRSYGRRIIRQFRASPSREALKRGHDVTFREFAQYVVDPSRGEDLNGHWNVMSRACHPCSIRYDFLGKSETMERDAARALAKLGVHGVSFPSRGTFYKHQKSTTVVSRYFSTISPALLRQVYELYKPDFLLFNYTMPKTAADSKT